MKPMNEMGFDEAFLQRQRKLALEDASTFSGKILKIKDLGYKDEFIERQKELMRQDVRAALELRESDMVRTDQDHSPRVEKE